MPTVQKKWKPLGRKIRHRVDCTIFNHMNKNDTGPACENGSGICHAGQGVKAGQLLEEIVQAGLASYVYTGSYKGNKSEFQSGGQKEQLSNMTLTLT